MKIFYQYSYDLFKNVQYRPGIIEFYDHPFGEPILLVSDDHLVYFLDESFFYNSQILFPYPFMYDVNEYLHRCRDNLLFTVQYFKDVFSAHDERKRRCMKEFPVLNFPIIPSFDVKTEERQDYLQMAEERLNDREMILLRRILSFRPSKENEEITHKFLCPGSGITDYDEYCIALTKLNYLAHGIDAWVEEPDAQDAKT